MTLSNTAKLLRAYMALTGTTCAKTIAANLDIPVRTIQRLKLDCATATDGAATSATCATDGVSEPPHAPSVAVPPSRVLDNNLLTNLEDSSVVKKDSCAVFRHPTNPRATGTAPRQRGSRDEFNIKFEQFWSVFPAGRKRAKGRCREAFIRIARGGHYSMKATADEMIAAAQAYALTKPDPQFVPMPLTWLNQGRWEDDLSDAKAVETKPEIKPFDWSTAPAWMREEHEAMNGAH